MNIKDTVAVAVNIIRQQGLRAFIRAAIGFLRGTSTDVVIPDPKQPVPPLTIPDLLGAEPDQLPEYSGDGVSVIIPNRNGANDLIKLLSALYRQKGFSRIEVILVDSGSTDESVQLAKSYGAVVKEIDKKDFSHSYARNLGAELAREKFLLFTVHDALPSSLTWLYQIHSFLVSERLSAISCVEKPRSDSDLFSRVENWYHYNKVLSVGQNNKILSMPSEQNPDSLRANAQLSNVACLMPKDVFLRYKFRGIYAEDLDLGLRLIGDGAKLGICASAPVIHSHTRSPYDYLRRGFVDKLTVGQLLYEPKEAAHPDFYHFIHDIFFTYDVLKQIHVDIKNNKTIAGIAEETLRLMAVGATPGTEDRNLEIFNTHGVKYFDAGTTKFLERIHVHYYHDSNCSGSDGNLLKGLAGFLHIMFEYLKTAYDDIDEHLMHEIQNLQYQYVANLIGRYFAVWYELDSEHGKLNLSSVKNELVDGLNTWNEGKR